MTACCCTKIGCPTLGAPLFLCLGWDTTDPNLNKRIHMVRDLGRWAWNGNGQPSKSRGLAVVDSKGFPVAYFLSRGWPREMTSRSTLAIPALVMASFSHPTSRLT